MDNLTEYISKGEYGEAILLLIMIVFGWLAKRAIGNVDEKIKENKNEVKELRSETELKFEQVADSLKTLADTSSANAAQSKEDIGKIESGISYITGFLEVSCWCRT